jgi:hypothetical protein
MKNENQPVLSHILGDIPLMRGAIVSVVLTLTYFFIVANQTINGIGAYDPAGVPEWAEVKKFEDGPWDFTLYCEQECNSNSETSYVMKFHETEMPVYEKVLFSGASEEIQLSGPASRVSGEGVAGKAPYTLEVFGVDENRYRFNIEPEWLETAKNRIITPEANDYKTAWEEANFGIKSFIWFFVIFTVSLIFAWLYLVLRATRTVNQAGK